MVLLSMTPLSIDQADNSPAGLLSLRGRSNRDSQVDAWGIDGAGARGRRMNQNWEHFKRSVGA